MTTLRNRLRKIYSRKTLPDQNKFIEVTSRVNDILSSEKSCIRPKDSENRPGGVIQLDKGLTTIMVSDLHARADFIKKLLEFKISNITVLELLYKKKIQIVCVGDAFHSEIRGKKRWLLAEVEFRGGFKKHKNMDQEMIENFNLIELIFLLKTEFPENFHFLKGNHENIRNENTHGNYPFGKYTNEGFMVKNYLEQFFLSDFIDSIYRFEKSLPLLAIGGNFLISHSEPRKFYPLNDVVNHSTNPNVIYDLTWTNDNAADEQSVEKMLKHYLAGTYHSAIYFAGHRSIRGSYNLRANGRFVQFHNPLKCNVVINRPGLNIDLERDVIDLNETKEI